MHINTQKLRRFLICLAVFIKLGKQAGQPTVGPLSLNSWRLEISYMYGEYGERQKRFCS